jgi:hypothetical protein
VTTSNARSTLNVLLVVLIVGEVALFAILAGAVAADGVAPGSRWILVVLLASVLVTFVATIAGVYVSRRSLEMNEKLLAMFGEPLRGSAELATNDILARLASGSAELWCRAQERIVIDGRLPSVVLGTETSSLRVELRDSELVVATRTIVGEALRAWLARVDTEPYEAHHGPVLSTGFHEIVALDTGLRSRVSMFDSVDVCRADGVAAVVRRAPGAYPIVTFHRGIDAANRQLDNEFGLQPRPR